MTNPNDPWVGQHGPTGGEQPTERLGSPGVEHTAPYGDSNFDQWGQPSNPTQALPPHEAQWGGYETGYPGQQPPPQDYVQPGYGQPAYGQQPPHYGPQDQPPQQPPKRKRNTGLWILLGIGVLALIGVVGVAAGLMFSGGSSDGTASGSTTTTTQAGLFPSIVPTTPKSSPSTSGLPGLGGIPGLGGTDDSGTTMGTIESNTGSEISLASLGGSTVRVLIDSGTQVISLTTTKAADLPVGDMVMVQGDKNPDGSVHAKIIISTALPGGPR
ncbi:DUF5666 domain-containing protein [Nocardia camponoti]|uniref:DUF5666 domain-containing protein n=1 Tax=Nocardia camponoti TaxID=1616106 RepID=A0A917QIH2_9NOCA|nr:DUF5666 domain-containing protein [Nocardia camponoti]GGK52367.1 hypothetical protein GCM10011591_25180 [Nocardia camponoti]